MDAWPQKPMLFICFRENGKGVCYSVILGVSGEQIDRWRVFKLSEACFRFDICLLQFGVPRTDVISLHYQVICSSALTLSSPD